MQWIGQINLILLILSLFLFIDFPVTSMTSDNTISSSSRKYEDVHFITHFCLKYDSIHDLRAINRLLKSRLAWGGEFASTACTVVAFNAITSEQNYLENHYGLWIYNQLVHVVSTEANCTLMFVNAPCDSLDSMIKGSLFKSQNVLELSRGYVFYVNPFTMITGDPLVPLKELVGDDMNVIAFHRGSSKNEQCEFISFLIPAAAITQLKENESTCLSLNSETIRSQFKLKELPIELRYSLVKDPLYSTLISPETNISILSMVSGAEYDITLLDANVTILTQETTKNTTTNEDPFHYFISDSMKGNCDGVRFQVNNFISSAPVLLGEKLIKALANNYLLADLCHHFFGNLMLDELTSPDSRSPTSSSKPMTLMERIHQFNNEPKTQSLENSRFPLWMKMNERNRLVLPPWEPEIYPWLLPRSFPDENAVDESNSIYRRLLSATRPKLLVYYDFEGKQAIQLDIIIEKVDLMSKCSIIYFASGITYLLEAYEAARRVGHYQTLLTYNMCNSPYTAVLLYTPDYLNETIWNSYQQQNFSIPSFTDFVSAFTVILQTSTDPFFLQFIPSDQEIFQAIHQAGQFGFQHSPMLFWQRMSVYMHPPSQYNLFLDTDVVPCIKGFESAWLELQAVDLITYIDPNHKYGTTNKEKRFPFPSMFPTSEWIAFPERLVGFVMLQRNNRTEELAWRYLLSYRRQLEMLQQGRTFIRGEQPAFREALYSMRHELKERSLTYGDFTFCLRPYSYFPACKFYHATDRYDRCPLTDSD